MGEDDPSVYDIMQARQKDFIWRLKCSLTYTANFVCLGAIISGLGPIIPIKAEQTGKQETDFGVLFTMRGIGYLLGSYIAGKTDHLLDSHHSMALGSAVLGAFALLSLNFENVFMLSLAFFLMGIGYGNIEVVASTLIVQVNREYVNPWVQAMHFGFGFGAMISPSIIANIEENGFLIFGVLAVLNSFAYFFIPSPEVRYKSVDVRILRKKIDLAHTEKIKEAIENHDEHDFGLEEVPRLLVQLISAFLFVYVGIEVGYGGWISTFSLVTNVMNIDEAAYGSSVFWATITIGRLLGIPAGYYFTTLQQMKILLWANLGFTLGFTVLALDEVTAPMIYFGSLFFGFCLSTLYPLALSVPQQLKMKTIHKNTQKFVLSGAFGEMVIPVIIGMSMDAFGPFSLFMSYLICVILMVLIYMRISKFKDPKIVPLLTSNEIEMEEK